MISFNLVYDAIIANSRHVKKRGDGNFALRIKAMYMCKWLPTYLFTFTSMVVMFWCWQLMHGCI